MLGAEYAEAVPPARPRRTGSFACLAHVQYSAASLRSQCFVVIVQTRLYLPLAAGQVTNTNLGRPFARHSDQSEESCCGNSRFGDSSLRSE
jgi:hypothetical protein